MKQYENYNIEFKKSFVVSIKKEVIAFGNSEGEKILIGLNNDGEVIGVDNPDDTMLKASNCLKDNIIPDIMPLFKINKTELSKIIEVFEIFVKK